MFGLLGAIIQSLFGFGLGLFQDDSNVRAQREANAANLQMNKETNATNIQLQEMANDANAKQAELSYQRSLPINQIRDLMNAGVSKSAAINKLTGGGVYAAPVMGAAQTQAGHVNPVTRDFSKMSEALQQLGNIPSNVVQYKQSQQNLDNLRQEYDLRAAEEKRRIAEEKRKQELHEFDMWSRQYGKENASALDTASNLVLNALLDSGKEISDFKSFESLIRDLGLSDKPILRNLPSAARAQLETSVRERFAESRAQQQQDNANQAARDAHTAAQDALKNSEAARVLSHHQVNKLIAETESAWQNVTAFEDATDARKKQNAAAAARADFERIMAIFGIAEHKLHSKEFWTTDADGNYIPKDIGDTKSQISNAWKFVGTFFGVDLLSDIVRGIVAISPK